MPGPVILPAVLVGGLGCLLILLRDPTFDRAQLGAAGARASLGPALLVTAAAAGALSLVAYAALPEAWLGLPRARPALWGAAMLGYPVLSAYPQELVFRAFFHHRYRALFPGEHARTIASAAAFACAHLVLRNVPAIALSFLGGLLFARTYERSRSLLLPALQHGLLGDVAFTVGFADLLYDGARATAGTLRF